MKKRKDIKFIKGEIVIYKPKSGNIELKVKLQNGTIWLTQAQIAELFGTERPAITKHLNNIFKLKELKKNSVCSILEHTATDGKKYKTQFYNLDAIISIGYRINSHRATQFRIWATKTLKNYLLEGYVINENRLLEASEKFKVLQNTINFLQKKSKTELLKGQERELLSLLADYSKTLSLLEQYDKSNLEEIKSKKSKFILKYELCLNIVAQIKKELISKREASDIFGAEVDHKFESLIKNLYQTFNENELNYIEVLKKKRQIFCI